MKLVLPSLALVQLPPEMPKLPEYVIDIFGSKVETVSEDSWEIYTRPRAQRVKWADFNKFLSPIVIHALRLYTVHCLESLAPWSVTGIVRGIKKQPFACWQAH
jgi:hypothetical protein